MVADVPIFATAPPAIPPGQNIVLQTSGQNSIILSDGPPTPVTGGIVLKGASGAMIVVNETGIYISNGQGATITLDRAGRRNQRDCSDCRGAVTENAASFSCGLDGSGKENGDMPGPILHMGAVVTCAHGGQAMPTVPSTCVMVSGMPIATIAAPYAVAGCAFVPPAGNGPCVTGAVGGGRDAGDVAGAACCDSHAASRCACQQERHCFRCRRRPWFWRL